MATAYPISRTPALAAARRFPDVPVAAVVQPASGQRGIQAAIDAVAKLPAGHAGLRGAVLLFEGVYEIAGSLRLASGVVLRGQGEKTILLATGQARRAVVQISGSGDQSFEPTARAVADNYVPVASQKLRLGSTAGLSAGDTVVVEHPSTRAWIASLGMDRFPSRDKAPT